MPSSPTLICSALAHGYGPVAKLLMLAPLLRRKWRLVFVGHGVAYELASRSADQFDRVVEATAARPAARTLVGRSAGLLSIMDREFAVLAGQLNKPLYVVDSLLWMREQIPAELSGARIYWAQRFGDSAATAEGRGPRPTFVGPIIRPGGIRSAQHRAGLLINFGGAEAAGVDDAHYRAYGQFVVRAILASGLVDSFGTRATIVGGTRCIAALRSEFGGRFEFASLSPTETNARIRAAVVVLTSPGLTNTLECFRSRAATFFLPPQNFSQSCVLSQLRRRRLAPESLHWTDIFPELQPAENLNESLRKPLALAAIARMMADPAAERELAARLRRVGHADVDRLVGKQSQFFRSLGANGSLAVARRLCRITPTVSVRRRSPHKTLA